MRFWSGRRVGCDGWLRYAWDGEVVMGDLEQQVSNQPNELNARWNN